MRLLLALIFLSACSSVAPRLKISDTNHDSLAHETLSRSDSLVATSQFGEAINQCYQGDFDKGLNQLKLQLEANKQNINYWLAISTCYRINYNFELSQFYLDVADQFKKSAHDQAKLYNNQGLILLLQDQYELAYQSFEKANKHSNHFATVKFNLAVLASFFGHYDYAQQLIDQILKKPHDPSMEQIITQINLAKDNTVTSEQAKRIIASIKND
jgi:Flp pilus assembly protein TadD